MKTVLLTGFEPFNGATINPAWEAVRALEGWSGEGFRVEVRQLPCVFVEANRALAAMVNALAPQIVIALGQAGGRGEISVERIAINVDDASILDNAGRQPVDRPIHAGAPAAYFSTLPIKSMVAAMRAAGLRAGVSQTAGTFVCNHVFYGLMHHVATHPVKAGFIHVPFLPEQAAGRADNPASMALADIVAGIRIAVEIAVTVERDGVHVGGATH
ncbi:pyroglutamyl-peptidase I [Massilia sp. H6]|uniref:pyroglutamyl-peptidase I n=1 Tax=Massilia sp. H6 TaxID=2970464 RepID=UPI002168DD8A|nr:pyroglutamyl-peptidase I [Massilia sp. H6]UVW29602.1 pyroglutamyl-peptidase I [Massilia sp. H6]